MTVSELTYLTYCPYVVFDEDDGHIVEKSEWEDGDYIVTCVFSDVRKQISSGFSHTYEPIVVIRAFKRL